MTSHTILLATVAVYAVLLFVYFTVFRRYLK